MLSSDCWDGLVLKVPENYGDGGILQEERVSENVVSINTTCFRTDFA